MTPEQKVVSLETAKKLREAGFKQDTERYWQVVVDGWGDAPTATLGVKVSSDVEKIVNGNELHYSERYYAAPDAQELLARIHRPLRIELSSDCKIRVLIRESEGIPEGEWFESDGDENLVDVLARCWLWLKESKLI